MLPRQDSNDGPSVYIYEAQISLLLAGSNESDWTVYCCLDEYMEEGSSAEHYYERPWIDAPSDDLVGNFPARDPRAYFLRAASRCFSQVTVEWKCLVATLEERLRAYVFVYHTVYRV